MGFGIDIGQLVGHWGYWAIFLVVILGNMGLPVPEEIILSLAGYLSWRGDLWLPIVFAVGVLSAVTGDNIGYWLGRRYGRVAIEHYGRRLLLTPDSFRVCAPFCRPIRLHCRFLSAVCSRATLPCRANRRHGRTQFSRFLVSNVLGAALYVPLAVGMGYAIGYGAGDSIERLRSVIGEIEHVVLISAVFATAIFLGWRRLKTLHCRVDRDTMGPTKNRSGRDRRG